jgi:hypothetical protein
MAAMKQIECAVDVNHSLAALRFAGTRELGDPMRRRDIRVERCGGARNIQELGHIESGRKLGLREAKHAADQIRCRYGLRPWNCGKAVGGSEGSITVNPVSVEHEIVAVDCHITIELFDKFRRGRERRVRDHSSCPLARIHKLEPFLESEDWRALVAQDFFIIVNANVEFICGGSSLPHEIVVSEMAEIETTIAVGAIKASGHEKMK